MKILFVSHTYLVETNQQKLLKLSKHKDVDLTLIAPYEWKHELKTYQLKKSRGENFDIIPLKTILNGRISLYFYPTLHKWFHRLKPDIVHIEEEPWALSTFQAMGFKRISGSKTLFFTWENIYRKRWPPLSFFERYVLKHADRAIAGNHEGRKILLRKGFRKSIDVLPQLGVDPELFKKGDSISLREKMGLAGFTLGYIGRLVREKGVLTLIEAAAKLERDFSILLVGKGKLKQDIIKLSRKLGITNKIKFVDTVPHEEVPQYLNCMDVLVLPSITTPKWKEQFGHVLTEAMSCEVPVIGSDSGEIPNVIADAGLVFREGDVKQLAERLSLLIGDERRRKELAKKGRRRVLENYTWEKIADKTYEIYQKMLE